VEITSIFGLPAHPLFVHVPVVLVPLAALGAVLMLWPNLRAKFGWATVVLAFVGLVFTQLAIGSGQTLEEFRPETPLLNHHVEIGENLRPWALLLFGFTLAVMLWDWWTKREAAKSEAAGSGRSVSATTAQRVSLGLCVLAILCGALSTYWVYKIGHSGAKATWEKTQVKIDKGIGNGGEGGESGESGEGG
jgi:uncharacterized membrane protein